MIPARAAVSEHQPDSTAGPLLAAQFHAVEESPEAAAFVDALNSGTASAAYLREADEVFARLYTPEPVNRLFR
jgi:hypothetical protein